MSPWCERFTPAVNTKVQLGVSAWFNCGLTSLNCISGCFVTITMPVKVLHSRVDRNQNSTRAGGRKGIESAI